MHLELLNQDWPFTIKLHQFKSYACILGGSLVYHVFPNKTCLPYSQVYGIGLPISMPKWMGITCSDIYLQLIKSSSLCKL